MKLVRSVELYDQLLETRLLDGENLMIRRYSEHALNLIGETENTDYIHVDVSPMENSATHESVSCTPEVGMVLRIEEGMIWDLNGRLLTDHGKYVE